MAVDILHRDWARIATEVDLIGQRGHLACPFRTRAVRYARVLTFDGSLVVRCSLVGGASRQRQGKKGEREKTTARLRENVHASSMLISSTSLIDLPR